MKTASPFLLAFLALFCASFVWSDEGSSASDPAAELEAAKKQVASQPQYQLRYKFSSGEMIRWKVVHQGTTETQIQGNTQTSKSRSVSTKVWRVTDVDDEGNITFTHSVDNVDMWQKLSDRPEVSYNSETDKEVPLEYQQVAKTVGVPLTTVTIRRDGQIVERDSNTRQVNLGLGDMVMLLPPKPVRAGGQWYEPSEIQVRLPDGQVKRIKTRKLYTLEKVLTGVATISVKTEVLTPVSEPRINAQLVQQLTRGTIKFDVDAGRVLSQQIDWDETVVGFNGPDSMMKYLARFTEELLPPESATAVKSEAAEKGDSPRRTEASPSTARAKRSDKPALRRR